jgi:hypothetical protein
MACEDVTGICFFWFFIPVLMIVGMVKGLICMAVSIPLQSVIGTGLAIYYGSAVCTRSYVALFASPRIGLKEKLLGGFVIIFPLLSWPVFAVLGGLLFGTLSGFLRPFAATLEESVRFSCENCIEFRISTGTFTGGVVGTIQDILDQPKACEEIYGYAFDKYITRMSRPLEPGDRAWILNCWEFLMALLVGFASAFIAGPAIAVVGAVRIIPIILREEWELWSVFRSLKCDCQDAEDCCIVLCCVVLPFILFVTPAFLIMAMLAPVATIIAYALVVVWAFLGLPAIALFEVYSAHNWVSGVKVH